MGRKREKNLKHQKPVTIYDTRSREVPEQCKLCARRDCNICTAKKFFEKNSCDIWTDSYEKVLNELRQLISYNKSAGNSSQLGKYYKEEKRLLHLYNNDINKCYLEDKHRGSGGGGSKNESSREVKSLMKDNSCQEVKERVKYEKEYYKDALNEWEGKNGALPRLKPDDGMTRNKVDSYTGEEIPETLKKVVKKK